MDCSAETTVKADAIAACKKLMSRGVVASQLHGDERVRIDTLSALLTLPHTLDCSLKVRFESWKDVYLMHLHVMALHIAEYEALAKMPWPGCVPTSCAYGAVREHAEMRIDMCITCIQTSYTTITCMPIMLLPS